MRTDKINKVTVINIFAIYLIQWVGTLAVFPPHIPRHRRRISAIEFAYGIENDLLTGISL